MQIIKEKIDITPDKTIFYKLGKTGYSVGEALAELVDNAIDARYENKPIKISIELDSKEKIITVEDDGIGMDKKTAAESIVLAKSEKEGKLGQFGLGLKTAAMSLGRKFTVETTQKGSKEEYIIIFDKEKFERGGSWKKFNIHIKKGVEINRSGTKITIEKLDTSLYDSLIAYVRKQLKERFSPFILNKEAEIKVKGKLLEPEPLNIVPKTNESHKIELSNGEVVNLWTAILMQGSQEKSGFNMYRKKRLIRAHEKLGYQYHPSKMWITGGIYLDCIPVTHNKREFVPTDPLYVEFLEKFQELIKPILVKAQQRHREKIIQDLAQEVRETLKDNILKAIGKVDDFQELAYPTTEIPLKRTKEGGELFEKEKRESKENIVEIKEKKIKTKKKGRTPRKTQIKKTRFITIAGKKYKFEYDWQELEDDVPKVSYTDKKQGLIMVILNSRFPVLNIVKDREFYIALYVTEGIVEEFLRENSRPFDRVVELRDKTMKELAGIITEDAEENIKSKTLRADEARIKFLKYETENKNIKGLSKREQDILRLRLIGQRTLQQIGEKYKLTRERVRQLEVKSISKILKKKDF